MNQTGAVADLRGAGVVGRYYALFVLVLVGAFNAADRSIVSVLAQSIKADLHIADTQLAFLYGTAFVTLYTLLGLPAAGLADRMSRPRLLAGGIALWSCFTALGGVVSTYAGLAVARVGVGVGEATANPASHSLICDLFPLRQRARALSTYLAGLFIGAGAAAALGGHILDVWPRVCGGPVLCGLRPWQVAFLAVGVPGILLAVLVAGLREPLRGASEGAPAMPAQGNHWRAAWLAFVAVLPVVASIFFLVQGRRRQAAANLLFCGLLFGVALAVAKATGDVAQWLAVFVGVNAIVSWVQHMKGADPAFVRLTVGSRAFCYAMLGYAFMGGIIGAVQFWMIPYAIRTLGVAPGRAGLLLGPVVAVGSLIGVLGGGAISDAWRVRNPRGYALWSLVALGLIVVTLMAMILAPTIGSYAVASFFFTAASISWSGACAAQAQDLVLPRMRATTSAVNALSITLVTLAFGPYAAGKIGMVTGSLREGLAAMLAMAPIAGLFLFMASRRVAAASGEKWERAAEE